jgi:hypothetical protein
MTSASLNFIHNDDLFSITIKQGIVIRVIWRASNGMLLGDVETIEQLPSHLQSFLNHKINNEYGH